MPHLVRAGKTLLRQVGESREAAKYSTGDLDGINRLRSIEFDAKTSRWLRPILEACNDPRIASLDTGKQNRMIVRFVTTIAADNPAPFAIDEADQILND
jgi:hypothetical protein